MTRLTETDWKELPAPVQAITIALATLHFTPRSGNLLSEARGYASRADAVSATQLLEVLTAQGYLLEKKPPVEPA